MKRIKILELTFINQHNKEISRTRIKNLILDKNLKINNQIIEDPSKKVITIN